MNHTFTYCLTWPLNHPLTVHLGGGVIFKGKCTENFDINVIDDINIVNQFHSKLLVDKC